MGSERLSSARSHIARVAESMNERIGAGEFGLTPYVVARISEDPRSAGKNKGLRKLIERGLREGWTIKKVAAMSTDAIETQLQAYGVAHSCERFLALAEGRTSAWSLSEVWLASDPTRCRGKDEDFLGLAACELWKRYLPDRPSIEMIDDWMQEGYSLFEERRREDACDIWWRVWTTLYARFRPEMTTMDATAPIYSGRQSIFNWSQDFELELGNVARGDLRFAALGRQYCSEWIAQFCEEDEHLQVNFQRALASFLFRLGETEQTAAVLHSIVEKWPGNIWGYVALADAYSHFFAGEYDLPFDLEKAKSYLKKALALPGLDRADREVVETRLADLKEARHQRKGETGRAS